MVGLADRADGDRGDARLLADAVGKRGLVHAAVDRLLRPALTWPDEQSIRSAPAALKARRSRPRRRRDAALDPVVRRDAHRHRLVLGQAARMRRTPRAGKRRRLANAAAVFVVAVVGQRRDEADSR
jgi:hypothetical protein